MKICERLEDGISSFYLSEKRFFPNLVELVNFYERNSLSENFTGYVNLTIKIIYVYTPAHEKVSLFCECTRLTSGWPHYIPSSGECAESDKFLSGGRILSHGLEYNNSTNY